MAVPTQPTLATIVAEGLRRAHHKSPNSDLTTWAEGWVEQTKTDLWNECRLKGITIESLLATAHAATTIGISKYALPSDCDEVLSITLLDGTHEDSCTAVASGQATLAADEDVTDDEAIGRDILLTSGTGKGNCSQISAYNETTKVATVSPNFTGSSFAGTEGYMIVDEEKELDSHFIKAKDAIPNSTDKDEPTDCYLKGQGNADSDETGEFELVPCPDDVYGLRLRYYINICLIDLSVQSGLMGTLYRKLRNLLVQGVIYRCLEQERHADWKDEYTIYKDMLRKLAKAEDDNEGGFMTTGAY